MAIKDKMLMITPTTLTLVKERTYRELFKSIDEKMLTIKCLGIKEKKETMTHVKKKNFICEKHLMAILPKPACMLPRLSQPVGKLPRSWQPSVGMQPRHGMHACTLPKP